MQIAEHPSFADMSDYTDELEKICTELERAIEDLCNCVVRDAFSRHWIIPASDGWVISRAEAVLKKARGIP
jgi:hypothetical protein